MTVVVRPFNRTTEASFPDNDSLPKKKESDKKFDKRFNEWWDEVRINLSKLEDQVTKYISKDLQEGLADESARRSRDISSLDDTTTQLLKALDNQVLVALAGIADLGVSLNATKSDLSQLRAEVTAMRDNLYSE